MTRLACVGVRTAMAWVAVAAMVAGCSGGSAEREYALPPNLCGLETGKDRYDLLFPPGEEVEILRSFAGDEERFVGRQCIIEVDGVEIIRSVTSKDEKFETFIGSKSLDYDIADGKPVSGDFNAMVWPGLAMAQTPCTIPGTHHNLLESFMVVIHSAHPDNDEESVEVLSQLIQPYMAAAIEGVPCAERDG